MKPTLKLYELSNDYLSALEGVLPAAMRGSRFPKHYDAW